MPNTAYPVLQEKILQNPARSLLRGTRRAPTELPEQQPGTVLVFEVNGSYRALGRQRLTGREPEVIGALSVSVVNTRPTLVEVYLKAPSASAADDFDIRIGFRCQVHSPEAVAEYGLHDIGPMLQRHLAKDTALLAKCAAKHTKDIAEVRIVANAQIAAYCKVRPPSIMGIQIDLECVEVFTPRGERDFAKVMKKTEREHVIDRLRRMGESEAVEYLKQMLASSEAARALAVSRDDIDAGEAARQVAEQEATHLSGMIDLIKVMAESDRMDRVPLDIQRLYDSAMSALTGNDALLHNPALGSTDQQAPVRSGLPGRDDDERYVPDEDDLTDDLADGGAA
ncbi:MAG TPA: hypothetical protein VFX16_10455 [Pseudonocardiaceae bacterium]|nr:hypothetical protein [Pseudonocardiaceae bacterium]